VSEIRPVEPAAGIAEVIDDGARGLGGRHLDDLLGIEPGAVFHGVQQHFPERVISRSFG
jgi:hypothetical protein